MIQLIEDIILPIAPNGKDRTNRLDSVMTLLKNYRILFSVIAMEASMEA
jgi:hypothetical protein